MKKQTYLTNQNSKIIGPRGIQISVEGIENCVEKTQEIINSLSCFQVDIIKLLGMRNLSGLVGEIFASTLDNNKELIPNPHQDGYPDILLLDDIGKAEWDSIDNHKDKSPFSPFPTGGFEIKATCGSTPTPKKCKEIGCLKPEIGDQRIAMVQSYDWKSHHRNTNNLFGIFWDFIDGVPTITAIFYSNKLKQTDWTKVVKPKNNKSRTTSVSMLKRDGVEKMYDNWIIMLESNIYKNFFYKYNKSRRRKSKTKHKNV